MIGPGWSLLWLAAAAYFAWLLISGFRTGTMEAKFRSFDRAASPANFWIAAATNLIIVAISLWSAIAGLDR